MILWNTKDDIQQNVQAALLHTINGYHEFSVNFDALKSEFKRLGIKCRNHTGYCLYAFMVLFFFLTDSGLHPLLMEKSIFDGANANVILFW